MTDSYILYKSKLQGEYKEVFEKIEIYVNANNLDSKSKEELMHSLIDSFLAAQAEQRPVEKVTGKNLERFCREFCSGYGIKEYCISFFEYTIPGVVVALFFALCSFGNAVLESFNGTVTNLWTYTESSINIIPFTIGLIIAFGLDCFANTIIKKIMFHRKKINMSFVAGLHISVYSAAFLALILFAVCLDSAVQTEVGMILIPVWVTCLFFGTWTVLYFILTRKRRRENISNYASIEDMYNANSVIAGMVDYEKKHYFAVNRKLAKKGKSILSQEEYIQKEMKSCMRSKSPWFYFTLPIVIALVMGIIEIFLGGYESIWDFAAFVGIILLIDYLIMIPFYRTVKKSVDKRITWLKNELDNPTDWTED